MRLLVAAITLLAGCHLVSGLDSFRLEGSGGSGGMAQSGGGGQAGDGGTGGIDLPRDLVDRGVVARWFLSESAGASKVADAVEPSVDLDVEPNAKGFPELVGAPGERGVRWATAGVDGFVRASISGTKLEQSFNGASVATIEVVTSLTAVYDGQTRLVHFGYGTDPGRLSLRAQNIGTPSLWVTNSRRVEWNVDLAQPRLVLHLVLDAAAPKDDRARLYAMGARVDPSLVAEPIQDGLMVNLDSSSTEFHIGNRPQATMSDGRSPAGTIHYVALYDVALTEDEIADNATALAIRDDP